jgi:hypothetical protein
MQGQGLDSPVLTSVAKAMAASAKSMAAVVLQLSTMPLANAARLGAGRSIASRVEAHSQAPPWLDNAVSKLFASSCCRALVPPVCSTESPSSDCEPLRRIWRWRMRCAFRATNPGAVPHGLYRSAPRSCIKSLNSNRWFLAPDFHLGGQAVKGRVQGAVKGTDAGPVAYAVKRESAAAYSTSAV